MHFQRGMKIDTVTILVLFLDYNFNAAICDHISVQASYLHILKLRSQGPTIGSLELFIVKLNINSIAWAYDHQNFVIVGVSYYIIFFYQK